MRGRIIGVFAVVVLLVVVVSFALMRASLGDLSNKSEAPRAASAAAAQLQIDALRIERWLGQRATGNADLVAPFEVLDQNARGEAATKAADELNEAARAARGQMPAPPERVVLVDKQGVVLGRNGSKQLRGEKIGERRPALLEALNQGVTGSDIWTDAARAEHLLVSYAPVRDKGGAIVGGVIVGTAFDGTRLGAATSGSALLAAAIDADRLVVLAQASGFKPGSDEQKALVDGLGSAAAAESAKQALGSGQIVDVLGVPSDLAASARRLSGYGDDARAVIIAVSPARLGGGLGAMLLPLLGVLVVGLGLVGIGGYLLDAYISRPVSDLEEGLLAVINGQTDVRFELEHAVLGGLVFRVNSLLNQLLGITEDTTDDDGRPSYAPRPADFNAALNVDERMAAADVTNVADATTLRDEPTEDYYRRVYAEYIAAKRSFGDPVDHITLAAFKARLAESETALSQKHGRPFRYRIDVQEKEVVLIAVPLG